jgi:hypothetical protein
MLLLTESLLTGSISFAMTTSETMDRPRMVFFEKYMVNNALRHGEGLSWLSANLSQKSLATLTLELLDQSWTS